MEHAGLRGWAGDAQKSQNCGSPTSIVTLRFRKNIACFTSLVRTAAGVFQTMGVAVGGPHYLGLSEGVDDATLCNRLLAMARESQVPLFVDPKPGHPDICQGATVVTPNLHEAEQMAGFPMRNAQELQEGGRLLLKKFGCEFLLVTRSSEGMTLFDVKGGVYSIPSVSRPVYDVTGAGDTVIATLALAYCAGASMREAAALANLAAGRVVLKFGTSQLSRVELLEAIAEAGMNDRSKTSPEKS